MFNKNCVYNKINEKLFKDIMNEVLEKDKNQVEVYIEEHYTDQNGGVIIKIKNKFNYDQKSNENLNLLKKYYVVEIDSPILDKYEDLEGPITYVYNVGYFEKVYVDCLIENDDYRELKKRFQEYDNKFNSIVFPFNDEGFINNYIKYM